MLGSISGGYQSGRTQTNSETTKRILTPEQQKAIGTISDFGTESILNPGKALEPLRTGAFEKVNQLYNAAPQNVVDRAAARGGGSDTGGATDRIFQELDMQRYGSLAAVENQFAALGAQQQQAGAGMLQQLLSQMFGQESSGKNKISGAWNIGAGGGTPGGGVGFGGFGRAGNT